MQHSWKAAVCYCSSTKASDRQLTLEQRQYKNNSIKSKMILVLKLPLFFLHRIRRWWKSSAISKLYFFVTQMNCSHILSALVSKLILIFLFLPNSCPSFSTYARMASGAYEKRVLTYLCPFHVYALLPSEKPNYRRFL